MDILNNFTVLATSLLVIVYKNVETKSDTGTYIVFLVTYKDLGNYILLPHVHLSPITCQTKVELNG